eukprot:gene15493-biopygen23194
MAFCCQGGSSAASQGLQRGGRNGRKVGAGARPRDDLQPTARHRQIVVSGTGQATPPVLRQRVPEGRSSCQPRWLNPRPEPGLPGGAGPSVETGRQFTKSSLRVTSPSHGPGARALGMAPGRYQGL